MSEKRPIWAIAREIRKDWKKPYFGAIPYLNAMSDLTDISDTYMYDTAKSVIVYFLANASAWRGDTAKRIKAELKTLIKAK